MTQNILRKLMLIAVLLTSSHAFAHDFIYGGIYYNITSESDLTCEVTCKGPDFNSYDEYTGNYVIPESVSYNGNLYFVTSIGEGAFGSCSRLTGVTIPNSVTSIGKDAFIYCDGLNSITIPNSVKSIGMGAFRCCSNLTNLIIPNSITSIGRYAFVSTRLTSVLIPSSVTNIDWGVLGGCGELTSIVVESGNIVYDSRNNCNAIIKTSTNTLIQGCKNTIIPNSVTSIGSYAFHSCFSLTSITIPNSVTNIEDYAFFYCNGLFEIICENVAPATASSNTFNGVPTSATLYVPVGSKEAYANATGWKNFTNIIEDDVKTGVESTLVDDVNVSVENGNIIIGGADNTNVEVYNVNGQCIYNGNATTIPVSAKGLYIVKVNGKSFKVIL